jgi:septum formation protein
MLEEAGIIFEVIVSSTDEELLKNKISSLPFSEQVIHLARAKAKFISEENPHHVIIGGDQMCVYGDKLLNKPGTKKKAIESLKVLSNQKHYQHSGVCIFKYGECLWEYSETVELKMHNLSDDEIKNYVDMENPINAAGAYKFESLGCNLFEYVNGSSHTVRGMPLISLLSALRDLDVIGLE